MAPICSMMKTQNQVSFKPFVSALKPKLAKTQSHKVVLNKPICNKECSNSLNLNIAAGILATTMGLGMLNGSAFASDLSGLTPCSESKAFAKQEKKEIKGLQKRQKLYEADSAPYLALQATIDRTENRFANYAKAGLLCGADGYPHLISDPGMAIKYGHAGEVFIPTIGFLYIAGYIGSVGRNYIQAVKKEKKPTEKEIIIDVPLALRLSAQGFAWPIQAVKELRNGTLTEKEDNITVSPR
eukprot:TRINITY_DN216_c0_g2_i10.p1 TRINITY_DN216_c0_g2~~TRINITY_DN216_c0_g2_i10.p1  ORF type:complete len:260 (+),score=51.72 TRINITY_DN216_c0_g2_i10:60-782(+)